MFPLTFPFSSFPSSSLFCLILNRSLLMTWQRKWRENNCTVHFDLFCQNVLFLSLWIPRKLEVMIQQGANKNFKMENETLSSSSTSVILHFDSSEERDGISYLQIKLTSHTQTRMRRRSWIIQSLINFGNNPFYFGSFIPNYDFCSQLDQ